MNTLKDKEEENMGAIQNDWLEAIGEEFRKPYYKELYEFVKEEYNTVTVYPSSDDIFNALHLTALKDVKVLVLGQDPYHGMGQIRLTVCLFPCCRDKGFRRL